MLITAERDGCCGLRVLRGLGHPWWRNYYQDKRLAGVRDEAQKTIERQALEIRFICVASGAAHLVRVALFRSRPPSTGRARLGRECDAFDFGSLGAHFKSAGHDFIPGMWIGPDRCFCVAVFAEDARATAEYLLANADAVPSGDEGFAKLLELAFMYAADNSHNTDAVHPHKAAILALGVILGEERVARVAKRPINIKRLAEFGALRNRITLVGRNDLARHFWVSAALAILSDENRSMSVGIAREMMDATEGGSGFRSMI